MLTVDYAGTILRSIDVVSRQFGDIRHHAANRVHPAITFTIISVDGETSHFTQSVRLLGMPQVDEVVQRRQPDGTLVAEVVSGVNKGMRLVQSFARHGASETAVRLELSIPLRGVKRLLKPLFAVAARRTMATAFEEDRVDLEERGYPRG